MRIMKLGTVLLLLTTTGMLVVSCGAREVPPASIAVNRSGLDARLRFLAGEEEEPPPEELAEESELSTALGGHGGAPHPEEEGTVR